MDKHEALAVIRKNYPHVASSGSRFETALRELIPDLKKSEDERVRKSLISLIYENSHTYKSFAGIDLDSMIAYLEKQKELPTNEEMLRTLRVEYEKGVADTIAKYEQKEQKPAEWSEDWREEDIQTRFAFYTYKDDPSVLYLSNVFVEESSRNHGFGTRIIRAAEKVAEIIGATTISLKVKQDSPANAWYRKNGYGYVAFEDGYDWLEKNLEYMKPNKQEWSEEDETCLEYALWCVIKTRHFVAKDACDLEACRCAERWLKSLRPQPHWKPSREQMGMLLAVINDPNNAGAESCHLMLQSLYADLEKL